MGSFPNIGVQEAIKLSQKVRRSVNRNVEIQIALPEGNLSKLLLEALFPETGKAATARSKVKIECDGSKFTISIQAKDTSALRAAANSYLRWIALVRDTYQAAKSHNKASERGNT